MSNARIFVVEDEYIVSLEIVERISAMGYQAAGSAASGEQALESIRQTRPDLVLMDIRLQGVMDGITTAGVIRDEFKLPVIFLTAFSGDSTLERAKQAGPYGYILKPFDDRELKSAIEIALYKHRLEHEILRMNRLYDVLSQVNRAVVRATSREALLNDVCAIMVDRGAADLAWIGWLAQDDSGLATVSRCASREELLRLASFQFSDNEECACNPGRAVRENQPVISNGCPRGKDCFNPSGTSSTQAGLNSCGTFPIQHNGRICGVLCLSSTEKEYFQQREIDLLQEVTMTISFALDKIESDARRQSAEEALRKSEVKFRSYIEHSPMAVLVTDMSGHLVDANPAAHAMLGYSHQELLALSVPDIHPPHQRDEVMAVFQTIIRAGGISTELLFQRKDGSQLWAALNAVKLDDDRILGFCQDITGRKRAEEELNNRKATLRGILDATRESILLFNRDLVVLAANEIAAQRFGQPISGMLGKTNQELLPPRLAESRNLMLQKALDLAKSLEFEDERNGVLYQHSLYPIIDPGVGATSVVLYSRDITERRNVQKEKEKLEGQLRHSQKLEAIGTLAGGIAHDFNNILSPIIGYTELTLSEFPGNSPTAFNLGEVLAAANRAKELVRQILSFSRQVGDQHKEPLDVSIVTKEALRLMRASLPSSIEIRQNISRVTAIANATQFHQVIVNLCTNAAHAMEDFGILEVSLEPVSLTGDDLRRIPLPGLMPGNHLKLCVSDTGKGMSPETISRIFDPYFTTKEVDKGTGLGLAVVHGIVKSHAGEIRVTSEPGKGSVFEIFIPIAEQEVAPSAPSPRNFPRGTGRILLVDDEQTIANMFSEILSRLGYQVTSRTSPVAALDLFRSGPDAFDLIMTDYTMPQVSGLELAKICLGIRHDIPVIIITGNDEMIGEKEAAEAGVKGVVMKPLDIRQLAELISGVLAGSDLPGQQTRS